MAFYCDEKVKTEIIDPHLYVANERVEFRLDSGTILNNLKVANLGLTAAGNSKYNIDAGALCVIKKISLFDGGVILQEQQNCNEHMAFMNNLESNAKNGNMDRFLKHHSLGLSIGAAVSDVSTKSINILNDEGTTVAAADSQANTIKGLISVKELLPLVAKLSCLPSKVFPQLRLVIEFETDSRNLLKSTANAATTTRPILIVDKITDETTENSLINQLESVNFMNYEYSNFNLPENTVGTQETNAKVMAFNNKMLNRLRLKYNLSNFQLERNGNDDYKRGLLGSSHNHNNRAIQYRVNGAAVLPRSNLKGDMRRLAMLSDSWGAVNMSYEEPSTLAKTGAQNGLINLENKLNGSKDFDGVYVGKRVEELQINISREFSAQGAPNTLNAATRVLVEGEVMKQFVISNGSYDVKYV